MKIFLYEQKADFQKNNTAKKEKFKGKVTVQVFIIGWEVQLMLIMPVEICGQKE